MQAAYYGAMAICCFAALQSALWASSSPRPRTNSIFALLSLSLALAFFINHQGFLSQSKEVAAAALSHLSTVSIVTTFLLLAFVASFADYPLKKTAVALVLLLSVTMVVASELSPLDLGYQILQADPFMAAVGPSSVHYRVEPAGLAWLLDVYGVLALGLIALPTTSLYRQERHLDATLLTGYLIAQAAVLVWSARVGPAHPWSEHLVLLPALGLVIAFSLRLGGERLRPAAEAAQAQNLQDDERLQRRKQAISLKNFAMSDPLTALPNRLSFLETADELLLTSRSSFLVYLMGINHFKDVNTAYGQSTGDEILRLVAERLRSEFHEAAIVARVAGDVFAVLMDESEPARVNEEASVVMKTGNRLLSVLRAPYCVFDHTIKIDFGLGAVQSTEVEKESGAHSLLIEAEYAMHQAKIGAGGLVFYDASIKEAQTREHNMLGALRTAQSRGELELVYQLKVNDNAEIVGMEALIRWYSQEFGLVPPDEFIPLAERYGLINSLGEWVAFSACQQMAEWLGTGLHPGRMSFNVSPFQLKSPGFAGLMRALLKKYQLEGECLEVEVTESELIKNFEHCRKELDELRSMGIHISIDDFGTGYSSLSYLGHLPLDTLKIDKSFVDNILETEGAEVVRSIIHVAKAFGCDIVAEGVENQEQLDALKALGCSKYQGYFFSRPLTARDLRKILKMADGFFREQTPNLSIAGYRDQQSSSGV